MTFISDRHSGLTKGIPKYFPSGYHSFCRNHLKKNLSSTYARGLSKNLRESILKSFVECMMAPTETLFEHNLQLFVEIGGTKVKEFLKEIPYENWASAHFKGKRYLEFDNNVAESFNMWIKKERALPIYHLVDRLRSKLMHFNGGNMLESKRWNSILCKDRNDWLEHMCRKGSIYEVSVCNEVIFEVRGENTHRVNLKEWSCTCQQWQQRGFMCSHGAAVIQRNKLNIYDYIEKFFTREYYQKAYSTPIIPSTNIEEGIVCYQSETILRPPITRRPPGRPAGRFKAIGEKKREHNRCSRCGMKESHNRKTCKAPIAIG